MNRLTFLSAPLVVLAVACGGSTSGVDRPGDSTQPPASPTDNTPASPSVGPTITEACNGLDDDGDGRADVGATIGACGKACSADAISASAKTLRLPRPNDVTVATDSGETPELTAMTTLPSFCSDPPSASITRIDDVIDVGCGAVLTIDARGLGAKSLRVAPGGIVRVTADTKISLTDTLLVCPNAVVQAGADSVRSAPADARTLSGHRLYLDARVAIVLGAIEARGGTVIGDDRARGGDGGMFDIEVERLLLAGILDNSTGSKFNHGEKGGDFRIVATKESFFSGTIKSSGGGGVGYVKVPVCCHGG
jgi:hypothetical protein